MELINWDLQIYTSINLMSAQDILNSGIFSDEQLLVDLSNQVGTSKLMLDKFLLTPITRGSLFSRKSNPACKQSPFHSELINGLLCRVYKVQGVEIVHKLRNEHLNRAQRVAINEFRNPHRLTLPEYFNGQKDLGLQHRLERKRKQVGVWGKD